MTFERRVQRWKGRVERSGKVHYVGTFMSRDAAVAAVAAFREKLDE